MPTNTNQTRMLATMIAVLATAGFAATAHAGDATESGARYSDVVVQFADLDLNSANGNKVLYARLAGAAERACGNEASSRDLKRKALYRTCFDQKLNGAVDQIGTRELQALHSSKSTRNVG